MKTCCRWTLLIPLAVMTAFLVVGLGGLSPTTAQEGKEEKAHPQQTQDGITVKLHGARYDAKKKTLSVRVEVSGKDKETVDFGTRTVLIDGESRQVIRTFVTVGTGKTEAG